MSIGARIREQRLKLGKTQAWLAEIVGVERSAVTQWERSQKASRPDLDRIPAIAEALETTPEWILYGTAPPLTQKLPNADGEESAPNHIPLAGLPPSDADLARRVKIPPVSEMPGIVPVYGTAAGGNGGGDFYLNGQAADHVRRPPGLNDAPGIFGIYVIGETCSPKYEPGDLIFIHPGRPPVPGSWVLVELLADGDDAPGEHKGPAIVRRMIRQTADKLVLKQLNPVLEITISMTLVKAILRILTNAELFGV